MNELRGPGRFLVIVVTVALFACQCQSKLVEIQVDCQLPNCGGSDLTSAMSSAVSVEFLVTVPGVDGGTLTPRVGYQAGSACPAVYLTDNGSLPNSSYGLTAFARRSDGTVVATGTGQITLETPQPKGDNRVFDGYAVLSPVERPVPFVVPTNPYQCPTLRNARAGFALDRLRDGRLVAMHGYQATSGDETTWSFLESADVLAPATGAEDTTGNVTISGVAEPRAFFGVASPGTDKLMAVGGEAYAAGSGSAWADALLFDIDAKTWTRVTLNAPRARATFGVDAQGHLLVLGGYSALGGQFTVNSSYEWFDPGSGQFVASDPRIPIQRAGAGMTLMNDNRTFVAVGGTDGTNLLGDIVQLEYNAATGFIPNPPTTVKIDPPRVGVSVLKLATTAAVVVGGYQSTDPLAPDEAVGTTDVLNLSPVLARSAGPAMTTARGRGCAALLPDGRALYIGGLAVGLSYSAATSVGDVTAFSLASDGSVTATELPPLIVDRADAACLVQEDGSVVIAGGVQVSGSTWKTLDSIEHFIP